MEDRHIEQRIEYFRFYSDCQGTWRIYRRDRDHPAENGYCYQDWGLNEQLVVGQSKRIGLNLEEVFDKANLMYTFSKRGPEVLSITDPYTGNQSRSKSRHKQK
jgi:hypothetical protein